MGGVGLEDDKAARALDSVKRWLDCEYGIVLHQPAFSEYIVKYGEISTYPQGYKENAGIFCHNNPWIMIAETMLANGDRAFDYYRKICPAYLEDISDLHKTEPYVYSQMIAGKDAVKLGEAKNSWLTGTAAWNYHAITEHILGIKPDYDGLKIDPCIPVSWSGFTVQRKFRGSTYIISVNNSGEKGKGIAQLHVDGILHADNKIPVFDDGKIHEVEVFLL